MSIVLHGFNENVKLTKRQEELLKFMDDNDESMVEYGREVWVGDMRTNHKVLYSLLRACFISSDSYSSTYYYINGSGKRYLKGEHPIYQM